MPNPIPTPNQPITGASVRVMRSHDYSHFEVVLSTDKPSSPDDVDALRKTAARLVDKAVDQYKIAKLHFQSRDQSLQEMRWEGEIVERLEEIPEGERTPEQQAKIKAFKDREFEIRPRYDYEDDWEDEI